MLKQLIKTALEKSFIEMKGVEDYFIFWDLNDGKLVLRSAVVAFKTTTISEISLRGIDIPQSNFVIRDPKGLLNLLDIASDDVQIRVDSQKYGEKLIIKDSSFESEYTLCDPRAVKIKPAVIEEPISYDFVLNVDTDFNEKFLKAKKANSQVGIVSVEVKDRITRFQLGNNDSYSNKIKFTVEQDGMFDMNQCFFSADALNEVIKENKKLSGKICVHEEQLMKLAYVEKIGSINMEINYFTLALDQL